MEYIMFQALSAAISCEESIFISLLYFNLSLAKGRRHCYECNKYGDYKGQVHSVYERIALQYRAKLTLRSKSCRSSALKKREQRS